MISHLVVNKTAQCIRVFITYYCSVCLLTVSYMRQFFWLCKMILQLFCAKFIYTIVYPKALITRTFVKSAVRIMIIFYSPRMVATTKKKYIQYTIEKNGINFYQSLCKT